MEVSVGAVELRLAAGRSEQPGLGFELAVGQETDGEERMRRAANSEVDLGSDEARRSAPCARADEELHRQPADEALAGKDVPDPERRLLHVPPTPLVGRKQATHRFQAQMATAELVMRRGQDHFTPWVDPDLPADDPVHAIDDLLDHSPDLAEALEVGRAVDAIR